MWTSSHPTLHTAFLNPVLISWRRTGSAKGSDSYSEILSQILSDMAWLRSPSTDTSVACSFCRSLRRALRIETPQQPPHHTGICPMDQTSDQRQTFREARSSGAQTQINDPTSREDRSVPGSNRVATPAVPRYTLPAQQLRQREKPCILRRPLQITQTLQIYAIRSSVYLACTHQEAQAFVP